MRLTCPNCGAQYEVPDEVIPESGRDVQCSNCGDTWFQHHPDHAPEEDNEAADAPHPGYDSPEDEPEAESPPEATEPNAVEAAEDEPEPEAEPEPEPVQEPEPEPEEIGATEPSGTEETLSATEADPVEEDEAEPTSDTGLPPFPRSGLDPAVADLLREEAAREEQARAKEGGNGLETQPDLGLDSRADDDGGRGQHAQDRIDRLRGDADQDTDDTSEPETDPALISRRNLLPDIDEINSSLDSEGARAEHEYSATAGADMSEAGAQKGGFNRGFMSIVLLTLILVLLYMLAPMISENVPAVSGTMQAYVDFVNAGRLWLNDLVASK